jgi:hypothetical protein
LSTLLFGWTKLRDVAYMRKHFLFVNEIAIPHVVFVEVV